MSLTKKYLNAEDSNRDLREEMRREWEKRRQEFPQLQEIAVCCNRSVRCMCGRRDYRWRLIGVSLESEKVSRGGLNEV